mmetsp:Transcript_5869/g.12024  ORF Transcript_5869/g.12024 Transcript_5869/m.12024 type:complete len:246 (-) Transcript_5869:129-866(-)
MTKISRGSSINSIVGNFPSDEILQFVFTVCLVFISHWVISTWTPSLLAICSEILWKLCFIISKSNCPAAIAIAACDHIFVPSCGRWVSTIRCCRCEGLGIRFSGQFCKSEALPVPIARHRIVASAHFARSTFACTAVITFKARAHACEAIAVSRIGALNLLVSLSCTDWNICPRFTKWTYTFRAIWSRMWRLEFSGELGDTAESLVARAGFGLRSAGPVAAAGDENAVHHGLKNGAFVRSFCGVP